LAVCKHRWFCKNRLPLAVCLS